jgi:PiT family inorganic phosphate transporter
MVMAQATMFDRHYGDSKAGGFGLLIFAIVLVAGIGYSGSQLLDDLAVERTTAWLPYVLLGIALLIALGFEFVNGFHDTANAVATVIYTHSMPPNIAVVWSGAFNFLGVLTSSGAVAFGIISLLPVELILQVGSEAGFAMVFALLIAAVIWNLGTWYFGLPNSSSHTMIGSVIGVGLMNQVMAPVGTGTSGVDWSQAAGIGRALLFSPVVGFVLAAVLLLLGKALIRIPALYKAPEGATPPPWWIRGLLILTCTGVSFAHGSNDGQKGMGLIMLILIGTVPTAYALNRAVPAQHVQAFAQISVEVADVLKRYEAPAASAAPANPRAAVAAYVQSRELTPATITALRGLAGEISHNVTNYGSLAAIPPAEVSNVRNDMYLSSEALRFMLSSHAPAFTAEEQVTVKKYRGALDDSTKFIPTWVKVAVAIALGLGTMVGWKRIVVTVGEKIGKDHLTYAQGASAELVAAGTIAAADIYGLPVSTTHVLTSGVAGTMAANRSGLQLSTLRNLVMAWVTTLPASIALAGALFWIFRHAF